MDEVELKELKKRVAQVINAENKDKKTPELKYEVFHVASVKNLGDIIKQGLTSRTQLKDNIKFVDRADNEIKKMRAKKTSCEMIKRGNNSLTHSSFSFVPNSFVPFFFIKPLQRSIVPPAVYKWLYEPLETCYLTINKQKLRGIKHHISILNAISTSRNHCLLENIQLFDDLLFNRISIPNEKNKIFNLVNIFYDFNLPKTFKDIRMILEGKIKIKYLSPNRFFYQLMESEILIKPPIPHTCIENIIIHPKAKQILENRNLLKNSEIKEKLYEPKNEGIWFLDRG